MPDIRVVQDVSLEAVTMDWLVSPVTGIDESRALATAVMVALNTDRRALPDDALPQPASDDRRGWWGDTDSGTIWDGWPIGSRLWLLSREKITDAGAERGATIERARGYVREALQPFVDAKIATGFAIDLRRVGVDRITGTITMVRGPKQAISLQWQSLWTDFGG